MRQVDGESYQVVRCKPSWRFRARNLFRRLTLRPPVPSPTVIIGYDRGNGYEKSVSVGFRWDPDGNLHLLGVWDAPPSEKELKNLITKGTPDR